MKERLIPISFPDHLGCLSVGDFVEEAYANAMDAKLAWFQAAVEDNITIREFFKIDPLK